LREQTAAEHRRAEGGEFQRLLFSGQLPQVIYVAWLAQLQLIHRALEVRLWRDWEAESWRELTAADRRRSVDQPPAELLGAHYVLEGSGNGNRMMARGLRAAYGLQGQAGTRSMDPYGDGQPDRWQAFKSALDEALPEMHWTRALEGARQCFLALARAGEEILPAVGTAQPITEP
jgi:heme oxygenase